MASKQSPVKPWAGRFSEGTDQFVEQFTESVSFDQRLYRQDIRGSLAHVRMLAHCGVLSQDEAGRISQGLDSVLADIEAGRFQWRVELEDVHMNIEMALVERIGEVGKKLHTARSRNDQVATDLRLYLRDVIDELRLLLRTLMHALGDVAEREAGTIMPGFTHMQAAQPVTFGHHLLAWCAMLQRDEQRLADCRRRVNVLPLGAAALAGTGFPIDRDYTARLLEFDRVAENSLDAVSDRDFGIEFCAAAALIMMHLSRFAEELVLWASPQYRFIELDDAWCTGSSIMPQKKNPDVPELLRGKTGRVYGDLLALLTIMKAQPLAYNRDNQEDKPALFDAVDTVRGCLRACCGMIPGIQVQRDAMLAAAARGYGTATDLADYLVARNVAFRDAHAIVGRIVQFAIGAGRDLSALTLDEMRKFSDRIDADVFARLTLEGSVTTRDHVGGTAPRQVRLAVERLRDYLRNAGG
ncbi:MAG: argininosuccinate lyase [Gammaproteobacteria bacterium RIFCSPLOWO2_02_FULL_61_13]|nr:MAG: argininosuccinate lyase [Gammaproteobacteria bacterium RIFCSPLOWO2_02_FULL_61_13]